MGPIQHTPSAWPWRIGIAIETPALSQAIADELERMGVACVFRTGAAVPVFEAANLVERERPDLVFAELARTDREPADWIGGIRTSEDTPLVIAVHTCADPDVMIAALRGGASEFVFPPLDPALNDCLDRMTTLLESRLSASGEQGRVLGFLSAKGGCGATTLACCLAAVLPASIVVDLDRQAPAAHRIFRTAAEHIADDAFESVRRLNSTSWHEHVTEIPNGPHLLSAPPAITPLPESWRIESCFRFLTRQYRWVLVDLGRQLNPACWTFLQSASEIFLVTAPDVLALYQTRSILQTLSNRGFDKSRVRLVLNRIHASPQDFWIESIEQMFEMSIYAVLPNDYAALTGAKRDRFTFPAESAYGRAVTKMAAKLTAPPKPATARKAA